MLVFHIKQITGSSLKTASKLKRKDFVNTKQITKTHKHTHTHVQMVYVSVISVLGLSTKAKF